MVLLSSAAFLAIRAGERGAACLNGFAVAGSAREIALEKQLDAELDPAQLREWLQLRIFRVQSRRLGTRQGECRCMLERCKVLGLERPDRNSLRPISDARAHHTGIGCAESLEGKCYVQV